MFFSLIVRTLFTGCALFFLSGLPGPAGAAAGGAAKMPVRDAPASPQEPYPQRADVRAFISSMADKHGFPADALEAMFARVQRNDSVLRLIVPAPGGVRPTWQTYRARFLEPARIRAGADFWNEHEGWLAFASALYGVPPEIIVAILGVETMYGRVTGNFRVIDALATLAFDYPRRADYFRGELEQFLLYVRDEGADAFSLRGSYAGAIGLPQFMPGSIRRYAVDLDGDGHIDLRTNPADAIGSIAAFLAAHGWREGEPVVFRVRHQDERRLAPLIEAGIEPRFTIGQLSGYGVRSPDRVPPGLPLALIDLPEADDAATYALGARNFYVITRYNRSSFYAMAVYELAQALKTAR